MRRYLALVWLAALGAACGFAPLVSSASTPENAVVQTGVDPVQPSGKPSPSGNPLWSIPLNSLTATRDRPIFSPSRRPLLPTPPMPVALAPAPIPPSAVPEEIPLKLLGTIVGRDHGIAICLNPTTNDVVRLRTGESFQGWVLRTVQGREAAFQKASLQARLSLPSSDEPQIPSSPFAALTAPPPPALQANAPASGTWRDGDGQLIAPPPGPQSPSATQANTPASGTWMDGDGNTIAPPTSR